MVEDIATCVVRLRNGVLVQTYSDFFQRPRIDKFRIVGEKGCISWQPEMKVVKVYDVKSKTWTKIQYDFEINQMYLDELYYFLECLRQHRRAMTDVRDGIKTVELIMTAKESWNKKKFVKLPNK